MGGQRLVSVYKIVVSDDLTVALTKHKQNVDGLQFESWDETIARFRPHLESIEHDSIALLRQYGIGTERKIVNTNSTGKDSMLSAKYQEEQNALDGKIDLLNGQISENSERYSNIETWVKLIKQYASPTKLDSILLNALVEKITVHEAVKHEDGSREQEVEIFYKFVGKID